MRAFKNSVNRATTASFRGSKMRGTEQMNKHRAKPCRYEQGSSAQGARDRASACAEKWSSSHNSSCLAGTGFQAIAKVKLCFQGPMTVRN